MTKYNIGDILKDSDGTTCRWRFARTSKPPKYHFTPAMDQAIRELYLNKVGIKAVAYAGPVKALAVEFGMPRWRISRRAIELGVNPKQKKEPNWSEKELDILERNAHLTPVIVQKYLAKAGYRRIIQGIMIKRKRLHISRTSMDGYTMTSLSECFGVDQKAVQAWIRNGWLKARKRGTARTARQGGDEWYIIDKWVREFIMSSITVVDLRKVDKYWFVDILTGDSDQAGTVSDNIIQLAAGPIPEKKAPYALA